MYFTYNGGPIFEVAAPAPPKPGDQAPKPP
jgi:hypothetical protein